MTCCVCLCVCVFGFCLCLVNLMVYCGWLCNFVQIKDVSSFFWHTQTGKAADLLQIIGFHVAWCLRLEETRLSLELGTSPQLAPGSFAGAMGDAALAQTMAFHRASKFSWSSGEMGRVWRCFFCLFFLSEFFCWVPVNFFGGWLTLFSFWGFLSPA